MAQITRFESTSLSDSPETIYENYRSDLLQAIEHEATLDGLDSITGIYHVVAMLKLVKSMGE